MGQVYVSIILLTVRVLVGCSITQARRASPSKGPLPDWTQAAVDALTWPRGRPAQVAFELPVHVIAKLLACVGGGADSELRKWVLRFSELLQILS